MSTSIDDLAGSLQKELRALGLSVSGVGVGEGPTLCVYAKIQKKDRFLVPSEYKGMKVSLIHTSAVLR